MDDRHEYRQTVSLTPRCRPCCRLGWRGFWPALALAGAMGLLLVHQGSGPEDQLDRLAASWRLTAGMTPAQVERATGLPLGTIGGVHPPGERWRMRNRIDTDHRHHAELLLEFDPAGGLVSAKLRRRDRGMVWFHRIL